MKLKSKSRSKSPRQQRGAIAILVGLSIAFLLAMAGLTIDTGRMYVARSELQSAMDACALSAARQLQPGSSNSAPNPGPSGLGKFHLDAAVAHGRVLSDASLASAAGARPSYSVNRALFQKRAIASGSVIVEFSNTSNGVYELASVVSDPSQVRFVKCRHSVSNLELTLIQMLSAIPGISSTVGATATVGAAAVASRTPGISGYPTNSTTCGLMPMLVCKVTGSSGPNFGFTPNQWMSGAPCGSGSGTCPSAGSGNFGWLQATSGTGASNLEDQIKGQGMCGTLPLGVPVPLKAGVISGVKDAWNSRFGLYKNTADPINNPPDFTGHSYDVNGSNNSWPYGSTGAAITGAFKTDYLQRRQSGSIMNPTGAGFGSNEFNSYRNSLTLPSQYQAAGRSRRVVAATFVDCSSPVSGSSQPVTPVGFGCFFLLAPYPSGGGFNQKIEYLGSLTAPDTPCSLSGVPGGTGTSGAAAVTPYLVQ
jgi:Putative Flp pilus-assembly TadE/G-like